jgi:probable addiction module antidote protein
MPKRTSDFRAQLLADLIDPEEAAHYFSAAADDSGQMALVALRDIAEAQHGLAKVAKDAGVAREAIYRMLSDSGNPAYYNLLGILKSLGLKMEVKPIKGVKKCHPPVNAASRKTRFEFAPRLVKRRRPSR